MREQHVSQPYTALLWAVHSSENAAVHGGRPFDIQRGVKQGDILNHVSPMFFDAALDRALRTWERKMCASWHRH